MDNFIHPTAIIDSHAKIGKNNYFGPYCIVGSNVKIGDNNRFEAFCSVGLAAQHRDYFLKPPGPVIIGDNNIFREYITISGGTTATTIVHNNCFVLIGSHIGHDANVRSFCNVGNHTNVGGHTLIQEGANLGLSVVIHQFRIVGAFAMIGMNSTVTKDMPPFTISYGSPGEPRRLNRIGLQRSGLTPTELSQFEIWFDDQGNQFENLHSIDHAYNKYIIEYQKSRNPEKNKIRLAVG